ncbi:hypothetical protein F5882DRAFT_496598 [Hyaloscypha sp. PMI_1271]|nr:hypothetical protein F5882DRAFT_496598 [Hyaloscypha sp. PMI_1271]
MTGPVILSYYTSRGTVFYTPTNRYLEKSQPARLPSPPCRPRTRRPHSIHVTRLPAGFIPLDLRPPPPTPEPKKASRLQVKLRNLASRENAKRVLGSVFSPFSSAASTSTAPSSAATSTRSASPQTLRASFLSASADPTTIFARRATAGTLVDDSPVAMSRPSLGGNPPGVAPRHSLSANSVNSKGAQETEKPVCSGNGVSCSIILAEPVIFLTGLDHDGTTRDTSSKSGLLRGKLQFNVTKSAKIKAVTVKFTGKTRTEWPEGIPPEKTKLFEEESLRTQVLPFFNALYEGSETGYGTMCNYVLRNKSASTSVTSLTSTDLSTPSQQSGGFSLPGLGNRSNRSSTILSGKDSKRLSLQSNQSRSFQKGDSPFGPTPQQKGYKVFHPGVYEYSFEIPIDNNFPETTKLPLASVLWMLEVIVERAGTFKANLQGFKEIPVIRSPSEDSLELVEPISISRNWDDQLHYEIMISGKSFPLGSRIPIAFKLTPLAKVQVHKLKVFVSECIEYNTTDRKVHRKDVARKILLLEKSAGKSLGKEYVGSEVEILRGGEPNPEERTQRRELARRRREQEAAASGSEPTPLPEPADNMLGDIDLGLEQFLGQTEIEMNVQLPTCEMMEKDRTKRMAHDCTWKNVDVHHWIKIVMRISRADSENPGKRRHFEISIDSPISILNCRATQANLALPEYSGLNAGTVGQQRVCGCPNAAMSNISPTSSTGSVPTLDSMNGTDSPFAPEAALLDLARPPQAHLATNAAAGVQRPIHFLRNPSFNPPAFDAEEPPPPIATPPPGYEQVVGTPSHDGLADYFARLGEYEDDHMDTDDEDMNRATSRGRVNVANPRTPGGRIARSMDIDRNFMFSPAGSNNTLAQQRAE